MTCSPLALGVAAIVGAFGIALFAWLLYLAVTCPECGP
jgi:hypothetical protein